MKKIFILLPLLLVASLFFNIAIHEYGHYLAADYYNLEPEIHFTTGESGDGLFSMFSPSAYTSYSASSSELTAQDGLIAFAGPFINLLFALLVLCIYLTIPRKKRTLTVQILAAVFFIPAIISFIVNLIPFKFSDGTVIYRALF